MKEVTLPSGAVLIISVAPFAQSKELYQACLEEGVKLKLDAETDIDVNFYKDLFCVGLTSKKIESTLAVCMKRCLYQGLKIDDQTFEPIEARGDYLNACFEIAKENILPFTKSLYAQYSHILGSLKLNIQA